MNLFQIVVKTVITTVDLLLLLTALRSDVEDITKRVLLILTMVNLTGVWI